VRPNPGNVLRRPALSLTMSLASPLPNQFL
jgi:hypothetical protein